jgi:hypothetical protein
VFPKEVPGLPPKRDINFSIDLVPREMPMYRESYRMSNPRVSGAKIATKGNVRQGVHST